MGAYPALDIKTPQQPDLLERYGQLMQLKNAQNEQALAPLRQQQLQQSVQSGGLQIQQQQQALKDEKARTAALGEWDGKNYNDLYPLILKNGGSASAVFALKKQALDQQHVAAETFKNQADAGKAQVETLKQKNDILNGALSPLTDPKQIPDEQLPQALDQTLQDLSSKGLMDPQGLQAAEKLKQTGDPNAIRQGIGQFIKTHMALTQVLDEAHKTAMEANQQAERKQAQDALANAERHQAIEEKQGQQRIGLEGARLNFEKKKLEAVQGDPEAAGQLLANGDATLSELKARGSTPDFIAKALFAAKRISGGQFNAQKAEADFAVAKSPANVAFFGSAKSLTDKGGTLDQLAEAAKAIPENKIPVFNSVADAAKAATGDGPIAKYASLLLGVSDDYAKVMGGGAGSDASRAQALHLVPANASPEARAAAIEGIRGAVSSQLSSRIGSNPVLKRMYGGETSGPAVGATKVFPNGNKGVWDGHGWVAQ